MPCEWVKDLFLGFVFHIFKNCRGGRRFLVLISFDGNSLQNAEDGCDPGDGDF